MRDKHEHGGREGWPAIRRLMGKRSAFSGEAGVTLVEVLIAVAILSVAITGLVAAFSTGSLSIRKTDRLITAESLARSQLEFTKSQTYLAAPSSYATVTPVPLGYSISSDATSISGRDANVQKITVTVQYEGDVLLALEGFKLDR